MKVHVTWAALILLSNIFFSGVSNKVYEYEISSRDYSPLYQWDEVVVKVMDQEKHEKFLQDNNILEFNYTQLKTDFFVAQPVYISITTISSRINNVNESILSMIQGSVRPTRVYLFISKEPYLIDQGISEVPQGLLALIASVEVTVVFTDNMGPHRKLLPVLSKYWTEDCFIVNVDDDMGRKHKSPILYQLLRYYVRSKGNGVVALRTRRVGICNNEPYQITRYFSWGMAYNFGKKEMLALPTGTGGILYKPQFLHPVVFDKR